MAQWDVYRNPAVKARDRTPYVVVMQSDLLSELNTRLVMPLSRTQVAVSKLPSRLTPTFSVLGETLTLKPQETGVLLTHSLGPAVASLSGEWSVLIGSLDAVISGV
jgi:toxin CcdB